MNGWLRRLGAKWRRRGGRRRTAAVVDLPTGAQPGDLMVILVSDSGNSYAFSKQVGESEWVPSPENPDDRVRTRRNP